MQTLLTERGFPVEADGFFGPGTASAVKAFQGTHDLDADGIVGSRTWAVLEGDAPPTDTSEDFPTTFAPSHPGLDSRVGSASASSTTCSPCSSGTADPRCLAPAVPATLILMKEEILQRLARPYGETIPERGGFARAIGAAVPGLQTLVHEILNDLDDKVGGVGWWDPHPDRDRRILISDHLVECISTIETNFQEARLHLWELEDFDGQISERNSRVIATDRQGQFAGMHLPRVDSPRDDLPQAMSELHAAGFARAIGSVLDCSASAIIGILGLPSNILRADFSGMLRKYGPSNPFPGPAWLSNFHSTLYSLLRNAGPAGWYDWILGFRNMLVHRARRTRMFNLVARPVPLVDQYDFPIVLADAVRLLPREPALSDVETLQTDRSMLGVLTEHEMETLAGIFASTQGLIEAMMKDLFRIWTTRRGDPKAVQQPAAQWPSVPSGNPCGFAGYTPGKVSVTADRLHLHPDAVRRMQAAGLIKNS